MIISFPRNTNHDDSKVTIKGNPDGVREAIKKIENVVQDLVRLKFILIVHFINVRNNYKLYFQI